MNDPLDAAMQRYFDAEKAAGYQERIRGRIPAYDTLHEMTADLLAEALPTDARVLVVGAGTGEETVRCARLRAGIRVTAVEPSTAMCRVAANRIAREGLERQVSLVEGLVTAAPREQFDAVTAILVMQFLPDDGDKAACLREVARRMKPGALLVVPRAFTDARGRALLSRRGCCSPTTRPNPEFGMFKALATQWVRHWVR